MDAPADAVDGSDPEPECPDADGDGVCDDDDVCADGDDLVDTDGDTYPDACDCDHWGIVCSVNAACVQEEDGPDCVCNDGWEGDGFTCTDIDECRLGTHTCDTNATCTNTPGSYTCACLSGWTGDGFTCTDIDECLADPCDTNATCTNTPGSFTCVCNTGYTGDGFTCVEIGSGPCLYANDGSSYSSGTTMGGVMVAMKFSTGAAVTVSRCEVFTGTTTGSNTTGIWSHDPSTNMPDTDLGTVTWAMSSTVDWQGVDFTTPIALSATTTYWVVWDPVGSSQASKQDTGTTVEYRGRSGTSWNGPFTGPWKYRCYCE
ncbi:MAG: DUF4082 domain-containing protein [Deltaproteobacteria bacterium]|nr:DUF4082 domain-containing protein [Deltaproteobacteria bacterium]